MMLDSLCEAVGLGSLVELIVRSSCFVSISASIQYNELDCEELMNNRLLL